MHYNTLNKHIYNSTADQSQNIPLLYRYDTKTPDKIKRALVFLFERKKNCLLRFRQWSRFVVYLYVRRRKLNPSHVTSFVCEMGQGVSPTFKILISEPLPLKEKVVSVVDKTREVAGLYLVERWHRWYVVGRSQLYCSREIVAGENCQDLT